MSSTLTNFSRKADKYGDLHFVSFLGAILSRLAYFNDNNFLKRYGEIMGPVIFPEILHAIDNVSSENIYDLLDDEKIFKLNDNSNTLPFFSFQNKKYIDFLKLNMPQNVNIINKEVSGSLSFTKEGSPPSSDMIQYISIGWSNYGEIFVVADKRMHHTLFLLFRGTYSAKTAGLYTKPTSVIPLTVCKDSTGNPESFLYGIFKTGTELIHTVLEAMRYLSVNFLGATQSNSIKVFTTGHSLGGGLCTIFTYLWMGIKKTSPYNTKPYDVLSDNIICISLGSPRCMSSSVADKFCNLIKQKKIVYVRVTSRGDPVPALPPKTGFQHPCSTNEEMRKMVSEDCNSQLTTRGSVGVNYNGDLDCQNYKTRTYLPNPLSHTVYLDILYVHAVDIVNFLKGIGMSKEVLRTQSKSTVCRVILGSSGNYKCAFFDVNKAREIPNNIDANENTSSTPTPTPTPTIQKAGFFSNLLTSVVKKPTPIPNNNQNPIPIPNNNNKNPTPIPNNNKNNNTTTITKPTSFMKIGGTVAEDKRMSLTAFNNLVAKMTPLTGDLCPQSGSIVNVFTNEIMPDLSCPGIKIGGKYCKSSYKKKTHKKRIRKKKTHKKKINKKRYYK